MTGDRGTTTVMPLGGGLSRSKSFTGLLTSSGSRRISQSSSVLNKSTPASTLSAKTVTMKQKRASWFGSSGLDSTTPLPSSGSTWSLNAKPANPPNKKKLSVTGTVGTGNLTEPRPQRALAMTSAVLQGLRGAIAMTEHDLTALKTGNASPNEREEKEAVRYLQRLDDQLAELEELQEAYAVQNRLREGVRAIGKAYVGSLGPQRDSALTNVKFGFKECNEAMCALEGRLEGMLGGLHVEMKGLQGFARLCAGDVFEITLRHGGQKWRTKGKVGRDGSTQTWDSMTATFRLCVEELLFIRAVEVRSLGKQVLLGNKFCETLDLLSAQPQMMTVSLTSSLKLNLVVTWDPLYGNVEVPSSLRKPANKSRSLKSSMSSLPSGSICEDSESSPSPDGDSGQSSTFNSTRLMRDFVHEEGLRHPSPDYHSSRESLDDIDEEDGHVGQVAEAVAKGESTGTMSRAQSDATGNFLLLARRSASTAGNGHLSDWKYYSSPTHTVDSGYEDSVHASSSSSSKRHRAVLDHAFFEEEDDDEDGLVVASKDKRKEKEVTDWSDKSHKSDNVIQQRKDSLDGNKEAVTDWSARSETLETVVQQLRNNIADIQGQYPELELFERSVTILYQLLKIQLQTGGSRSQSLTSLTDVNHALECFDFLDAEEALMESGSAENVKSEPKSSAATAVIFTAQLDETLLIHLKYSRHLTDMLGNYGPLKRQEERALEKLQVQGRILSKLAKLIEKWQVNPSVKLSIHEELRGLPHLQKLWGIICAEARSLSISSQDTFVRLLPLCGNCLPDASISMQEKVLKELIARCQDVPQFRPDGRLTVFQFRYYVRSKEQSFALRLQEIHDELRAVDALRSKDPILIHKTITRLVRHPGQFNTCSILVKMAHLLFDPDQDRFALVTSFLRQSADDEELREKLLNAFIEGLESTDPADRQGSCHALGILHDPSVVDQLAYVAQSDPAAQVRKRAKMSLESLGPEGRSALQNIELSSHGFQGVTVK